MIPIRTAASNFVYRGPTPDIGDAWVERKPRDRAVYLTWEPSAEERAVIAAGGTVRLGIYGMEPIPPVSLEASQQGRLPERAVALRDRAMAELRRAAPRGPDTVPAGFWAVSATVWALLQECGALDPADGSVPKLLGRPLMSFADTEDADLMTYDTTTRVGGD